MKLKILSLLIFLFVSNCNKPKTVLICGNHICVNKAEANQYFEENLSIEVKIINSKSNKKDDLVELNLRKNSSGDRKISYVSKTNTDKVLKKLSDDEIVKIKRSIKDKKKISKKKISKKVSNKNKKITNKKSTGKRVELNDQFLKNNVNKKNNDIFDVCTVVKNCNIDEISKYLINEGKKKNFPNIMLKQ